MMKIAEILKQKDTTISFEVFPPKKAEGIESVERSAFEISALKPDFMSVTYGAGGGTSAYTLEIASRIQKDYGVPSLAHLTCVSSTRDKVHTVLNEYTERGIENVLALRGDIPTDGKVAHDYKYASELISEIKELKPELCIGAACYPEGHVECENKSTDILHLKEKADAGADFLTTQMFFDNNILYNFLYRIREAGITIPVIAGIMPITNVNQVKRTISMSGTVLPEKFKDILDRFGDNPKAMEQAGVVYAAGQIIDLVANKVNGIHVYSMNKPHIAAQIMNLLSEIL